ncbi:hypothetical protein QTP88_017761 [Uroleucon formosanum]
MIKCKGRSTIKQYNPMKPIKRDYKLWCIVDQNGYILIYSVYQGKNETLEQEFDKYNLGERVILMLTKPFWKQQRIIIFDNYFTSITLLKRLKNEQTLACGSIRNNRKGMPQNLKKKSEIKRGDFDHRFSTSRIVIFKWKDNKVVYLASKYHGNETTTVQRTSKDGSKLNITCPTLWWLRIFWGLLDIVFVNAYVVYCQIFGKMDVLEVRRSIALGLISECDPTSKRSICIKRTPPTTPNNRRKQAIGIHWPAFGSKRGKCELCSIRGVESRPTTTCSHCRALTGITSALFDVVINIREWLAAADVIENLMLRLVLRPNYICKKQTSCNLTIKLILANNIDDRGGWGFNVDFRRNHFDILRQSVISSHLWTVEILRGRHWLISDLIFRRHQRDILRYRCLPNASSTDQLLTRSYTSPDLRLHYNNCFTSRWNNILYPTRKNILQQIFATVLSVSCTMENRGVTE